MAAAGLYVIKGRYVHLPIDVLLGGRRHHSDEVGGVPMHELEERDVPLGMTVVHGLIAGLGAYASVITFVLAPRRGLSPTRRSPASSSGSALWPCRWSSARSSGPS